MHAMLVAMVMLGGVQQEASPYLRRMIQFDSDCPSTAVAVAVVHRGNVVYKDFFGFARPQERTTAQTLFPLGKASDLFVSLAILSMIDSGKLKWETKPKRVPEPAASVQNLLTHTTPYESFLTNQDWQEERKEIKDWRGLFPYISTYTAGFEMGREVSESATNSVYLVAELLDVYKGLDLAVRTHVFKPFSLPSARITPTAPNIDRWTVVEGEVQPATGWVDFSLASAGWHGVASLEDYLALDRGVRAQIHLKPGTWTKATQPFLEESGFGAGFQCGLWLDASAEEAKSIRWFGRVGGGLGGSSLYLHSPDEDLSIMILTNYEQSDALPVAEELRAIALGRVN